MQLRDRSIVVIGGSSGIGLAIAKMAAEVGAKVTIASRSLEKLQLAQKKISSNVDILPIDLNDEESVEEFFAKQQAIDHLITTAGTPKFGDIFNTTFAEAKTTFDDYFWRAFLVAKYGIPKINKHGSLLLTSGMLAVKPMKGAAVIGAALGALENFAKALAIEISPIRVNVLSPGLTRTPLLGDNPEEQYAEALEKLLIKRITEPEEVAHTALYLMTNNYITGQVMRIDGGSQLT